MSDEKVVDIGFLEKKEGFTRLLDSRFFPSKVGGFPAWLDHNLPHPSTLQCPCCESPMIFLCQVYAPFEESEKCFHRTIFIFICRNGSCCQPNSAKNFIVLRSQLPRKNSFYSFDPPNPEREEEFSKKKWLKLCVVCGAKAPSHCSKCKRVFYCSRKHQILDWQKEHKQNCALEMDIEEIEQRETFRPSEAGKSLLFEEWELVVDIEDEESKTEVNVETEMEKMQKLLKEKSVSLNNVEETEMEQYVNPIAEDKIFNKFNKRVARHPKQVLRYDRGGQPLWMTSINPELLEIPKCQYCDGERQFEFQIMPQLLNYINVGLDFNSIDWGVLAVYTCKNSCSEKQAYKLEHLIKQDLVNKEV